MSPKTVNGFAYGFGRLGRRGSRGVELTLQAAVPGDVADSGLTAQVLVTATSPFLLRRLDDADPVEDGHRVSKIGDARGAVDEQRKDISRWVSAESCQRRGKG